MTLQGFEEIVFLDFEYRQVDGEIKHPVCLVAKEARSGRIFRVWLDGQGWRYPVLPNATGPFVVVVAFMASAELGCYLSLGWPFPSLVIDLYSESRMS